MKKVRFHEEFSSLDRKIYFYTFSTFRAFGSLGFAAKNTIRMTKYMCYTHILHFSKVWTHVQYFFTGLSLYLNKCSPCLERFVNQGRKRFARDGADFVAF